MNSTLSELFAVAITAVKAGNPLVVERIQSQTNNLMLYGAEETAVRSAMSDLVQLAYYFQDKASSQDLEDLWDGF